MSGKFIRWPDGLDEQGFLSRYWQRRPLLIRQAFPDFETPLPADELAGLSTEPDTTPRLVTRDSSGRYHLEHGPFDADRFQSLTGNDWSLLVTDVEKHLPGLAVFLEPFSFLPLWRMDDLMISYAPVGASVGAHVDEYDVFLMQASGSRKWSIDGNAIGPGSDTERGTGTGSDAGAGENSGAAESSTSSTSSQLRLLDNFTATDCWELNAGDVLYLPAGVPHHGVASAEPCTTWSIGFRAPLLADLVMRIAEMICESLPHERYQDPPLDPAVPGEITASALACFEQLWRKAVTVDNDALALMIGRFLTESTSPGESGDSVARTGSIALPAASWRIAPFSRIAWKGFADSQDETVLLFVDGETHRCYRSLAIELCKTGGSVTLESADHAASDLALLQHLVENGSLVAVEEYEDDEDDDSDDYQDEENRADDSEEEDDFPDDYADDGKEEDSTDQLNEEHQRIW